MGRTTGADGVRGGPRRPGSTAARRCAAAGRRAVLDRFHPRDQAGVPHLDVRPVDRVRATDLASTDRRRHVLRAAVEGHHRAAATRRDHRGQRQLLPGVDHCRRAVRAHRQLPATGDEGARHPTDVQRFARRRSLGVGCVPDRVRPRTSADVAGLQRMGPVVRRSPLERPRVHPREPRSQPLHLSRGHRLHRSAATRTHMASPRLVGAHHRRAVRGAHQARYRRRADLPLTRFARLCRCRVDATPDRGAGPHATSLHRVEGPAARHLRAPRQHVGRPAGPADHRAPRSRPRHHPWRQQHHDRVLPLRQADGAVTAVLGPVRQRAAGARDRLRRAPGHLRLR